MKSMTCKQLGGACDKIFRAATFEDMAARSKEHGKEMFEQKDPAHLEAMSRIKTMMQSPEQMEKWFAERRAEFAALPDN